MVEALSVDPVSRTITMDWYPKFTALKCTEDPLVSDILLTEWAKAIPPSIHDWLTQAKIPVGYFEPVMDCQCPGSILTLHTEWYRELHGSGPNTVSVIQDCHKTTRVLD